MINEEVNGVYNYNQLKIPLFSHKAIKKINNSEYLAICVTNQPGIAKGFFSIDDLNMIHAKLDTELGANGAYLDDLFFCPHHPESGWDGEKIELKKKCNCRKPMPGMFIEASNKHNLDLKNSYFISDTAKDLSVSKKIDINIVLVETGYATDRVQAYLSSTHAPGEQHNTCLATSGVEWGRAVEATAVHRQTRDDLAFFVSDR